MQLRESEWQQAAAKHDEDHAGSLEQERAKFEFKLAAAINDAAEQRLGLQARLASDREEDARALREAINAEEAKRRDAQALHERERELAEQRHAQTQALAEENHRQRLVQVGLQLESAQRQIAAEQHARAQMVAAHAEEQRAARARADEAAEQLRSRLNAAQEQVKEVFFFRAV
jgi:hypothetical protein